MFVHEAACHALVRQAVTDASYGALRRAQGRSRAFQVEWLGMTPSYPVAISGNLV